MTQCQQQSFNTQDGQIIEIPFFLSHWQSLGPFRIGTREAVWGADPLEAYGGFPTIPVDIDTSYHSPLTTNAVVQWRQHVFQNQRRFGANFVSIELGYRDVDWNFAQKVFGWPALQYQSWLRGHIFNPAGDGVTIRLYPNNVLEYWINDEHVFGGDYYGYDKVPLIVKLKSGLNVLNARLIRDCRASGGSDFPTLIANFRIELVRDPLVILEKTSVLPDLVNGRLTGRYFSVTASNEYHEWLQILSCEPTLPGIKTKFMRNATLTLAPGQSRPITVQIETEDVIAPLVSIVITYKSLNSSQVSEITLELAVKQSDMYKPHRMTFLHPSGVVSYAIVRPPSVRTSTTQQLPVILALHGSGLEADSAQVRRSLDEAADIPSWVVFPTGMSPWCGDDWHSWGQADAIAAVESISDWMRLVNWTGPGVWKDRIMVIGHSNGGQGTWYFATHQPDYVLAAAAASGFSSLQTYVPYSMWVEADAMQTAVVQAALTNTRHELLIDNINYIPLLDQHGALDDNVPPYASRLMQSLSAQKGIYIDYEELPGRGHWFEGTMTTPQMLDFYQSHLDDVTQKIEIPKAFNMVCPNSNDLGSKFGIRVDQLCNPGRLGQVKVEVHSEKGSRIWHMQTMNIKRIHIQVGSAFSNPPHSVFIDSKTKSFAIKGLGHVYHFEISDDGSWHTSQKLPSTTLTQRFGHQRGALDAIMNTRGPFQIVVLSEDSLKVGVQASRNMLQYFGADSVIWPGEKYEAALAQTGNVITISMGPQVPASSLASYPIKIDDRSISFRSASGQSSHIQTLPGMGGVMLRPLDRERLELLVWGYDEPGLQQAVRLIPTLTGAGQPDFVFLSREGRWLGHAGAVAMGYLDFAWNISTTSYL